MTIIKRPIFEAHKLEGLCRIIGDTVTGLSATEIGQILLNSNIPDIDSQNTKWKRLYIVFAEWQNRHQCSNHILRFIQDTLQPDRSDMQ